MKLKLEQKKLLFDIQEAIESIDLHLNGERFFQKYLQNKTQRRAVERELEIIGEAMNLLLKIDQDIPISFKRIIVDLRNRVIHSYDSIDNEIIWKVVMKDIPVLANEVKDLLQ